jgi:hypothetical protein
MSYLQKLKNRYYLSMKKLIRVFAALALIAGLAAPAAAQTTAPAAPPADVVGSWDVNFTTDQGPIPGYLKFKKDGDKLVGTVGSQMGEAPMEAEVKGSDVSVWFNFQAQNGPIAIEMTGKVAGDKITGTFTAGGQAGGQWVATRTREAGAAPAPAEPAKDQPASAKVDLTGEWGVTVELPSMTATPSLTLKQAGDKLTGDYVSAQYGKFPVAGTVKGTDVTFSFTMSVEGTGIDVTYIGTIDKDGNFAGSVNYGDMMSGRFTALKKK